MRYAIRVSFSNGSESIKAFHTFTAAMDYARNGISYSGERIARVVLNEFNAYVPGAPTYELALWDSCWNDESKRVGLTNGSAK